MMTTLREAAQQALEALVIGSDAAHEVAQNYHEAMAGYRPARHIAVDDDVRTIEAAIAALRAALADGDKAAPTEPEPLTYEQLAKLGNDIVCLWDPPKWGMSELWEASLVEFGRAVEAAHGINAPSPGSDGCDHCRHPLYAAIKCSQCGRVTE